MRASTGKVWGPYKEEDDNQKFQNDIHGFMESNIAAMRRKRDSQDTSTIGAGMILFSFLPLGSVIPAFTASQLDPYFSLTAYRSISSAFQCATRTSKKGLMN